MKKILLSVMAAAAIVCMASCSKSNKDLINDYRKATTEMVDALKSGDMAKADKAGAKAKEIGEELEKRDLTTEEKQEIVEIAFSAAGGAFESVSNGLDLSNLDDLDVPED